MTELRNVEADLSRFRMRVLVASLVVVLCFLLLAARLVYLQVVRHDDLLEQAENNRTAIVPVVPNRGLILDRNGIVLATNYSAYTLEITPSKTNGLEQTIDELAKVMDVTARDRRRFKKLMEEGLGKLAAVYCISLFGFIIWVGLFISWLFFHGVKPPTI